MNLARARSASRRVAPGLPKSQPAILGTYSTVSSMFRCFTVSWMSHVNRIRFRRTVRRISHETDPRAHRSVARRTYTSLGIETSRCESKNRPRHTILRVMLTAGSKSRSVPQVIRNSCTCSRVTCRLSVFMKRRHSEGGLRRLSSQTLGRCELMLPIIACALSETSILSTRIT